MRYRVVWALSAALAATCWHGAAPACMSETNVYFPPGSAIVDPQGGSALDTFAAAYSGVGAGARIRLIAASDTLGPASLNLVLSRRRGEAVRDYLAARGIFFANMEVVARGETDLPVPTADGVAEPGNRVVTVRAAPPSRQSADPGHPAPTC